jgi:hypothetical protein
LLALLAPSSQAWARGRRPVLLHHSIDLWLAWQIWPAPKGDGWVMFDCGFLLPKGVRHGDLLFNTLIDQLI